MARMWKLFTGGFAALFALSLLLGAFPGAAAASDAMTSCAQALGIGKAGDACVNIIHASPNAPAVDVYLDGAKALSGLKFGKDSGWVAVPAGGHEIQVTATGADLSSAVVDAKVTLSEGVAYEAAATGLLANITVQVRRVDLAPVGSADKPMARIRVVHASTDAPAVDIAVKGGDVLVSDLAYPHTSGWLEVPADTYDLEVRPAGQTDVALALPGVKLEAGMVYSFYAIGELSNKTLTVLPVVSTTSTTGAATATPSM